MRNHLDFSAGCVVSGILHNSLIWIVSVLCTWTSGLTTVTVLTTDRARHKLWYLDRPLSKG
jgi:hypothetical protein